MNLSSSTRYFRWFYMEFLNGMRGAISIAYTTALFIMLILILPFIYGLEVDTLKNIVHKSMWFYAVLIMLLSFKNIYEGDYQDNTLEYIICSKINLFYYVFVKIIVFWLLCGVPIILCVPFLSFVFDGSWSASYQLCVSLIIGMLACSALCNIGASFHLMIPRAQFLSVLFLIPLMVPVLIFGISASSLSDYTYSASSGLIGLTLMYNLLAILSIVYILRVVVTR